MELQTLEWLTEPALRSRLLLVLLAGANTDPTGAVILRRG